MKEHIRIIEIGFGWNDVHIAWSKNWRYFTGEELIYQLIDIVLSVEGERDISPETKLNFLSRGERTQFETISKDLDVLDNEREAEKDYFKITPAALRETM